MSFADFVSTTASSASSPRGTHTNSKTNPSFPSFSLPSRQAIDTITLKLAQFQRQVLAIKRASLVLGTKIEDDFHDRIRFACLLQEEIAQNIANVPIETTNSVLKRKLCKDFETIATQLETAVRRETAHEQEVTRALKAHEGDEDNGRGNGESHGGYGAMALAEIETELAHNEALIQEREEDLNAIHQNVTQVNEIFRDLAAIVQDQQQAIDDIETHVQDSMIQTKEGLEQVKKASEMQGYCIIQ